MKPQERLRGRLFPTKKCLAEAQKACKQAYQLKRENARASGEAPPLVLASPFACGSRVTSRASTKGELARGIRRKKNGIRGSGAF